MLKIHPVKFENLLTSRVRVRGNMKNKQKINKIQKITKKLTNKEKNRVYFDSITKNLNINVSKQ